MVKSAKIKTKECSDLGLERQENLLEKMAWEPGFKNEELFHKQGHSREENHEEKYRGLDIHSVNFLLQSRCALFKVSV